MTTAEMFALLIPENKEIVKQEIERLLAEQTMKGGEGNG